MPERLIPLGPGESAVSRDPDDVLAIYGLGSCIALLVVAGDCAAMAHVVLPQRPPSAGPDGKYADTALEYLLGELKKAGARAGRLVVCLVGGARMFPHVPPEGAMDIGYKNEETLLRSISLAGIVPDFVDTGGTWARTVKYYSRNKSLKVTFQGREKVILLDAFHRREGQTWPR